jgi:hypothetical protein
MRSNSSWTAIPNGHNSPFDRPPPPANSIFGLPQATVETLH